MAPTGVGVHCQPCVQGTRHYPHKGARTEAAWHHNSSHTVEFSRNRRPNHSSRNFRSDRLRPGVVRSCFVFFCSCFALDLSRPSAFPAISAGVNSTLCLIAITGWGFFFEPLPRRLRYSSMDSLGSRPPYLLDSNPSNFRSLNISVNPKVIFGSLGGTL
jgi:hypothetical protein